MPEPNPTVHRLLDALRSAGARRVLDIGCGPGALAGPLLGAGYEVTGIDPQPAMIDAARARFPKASFLTGQAQALPFAAGAFDAAIFLNALHHVPHGAMLPALCEALRVLVPDGVLIVIEPLAEGPYFEAMRPVEDETEIRAQALTALDAFRAQRGAVLAHHERYDRVSRFSDVDAFARALSAADPARAAAVETNGAALADLFAEHAVAAPNGYRLVQPLALWVFRKDV